LVFELKASNPAAGNEEVSLLPALEVTVIPEKEPTTQPDHDRNGLHEWLDNIKEAPEEPKPVRPNWPFDLPAPRTHAMAA
jgi:hypothetical protein